MNMDNEYYFDDTLKTMKYQLSKVKSTKNATITSIGFHNKNM